MEAHDAEFTDFVASRSKALFRTAYLVTGGDYGLAEDLLQTALIKTYARWGRLRAVEHAEAYARRAVVTTATSWWRKKSSREKPTDCLPEWTTESEETAVADRDLVRQEVRALPPRQRAAVVLRFYEDLTETQAAAAMGCSVGNVKSLTHVALKRLRARLGTQVELELTRGTS